MCVCWCVFVSQARQSSTREAFRCKSGDKGVGFHRDGGRKAGDFQRLKEGGREGEEAGEKRGGRGEKGKREVKRRRRWRRISHRVLPYFFTSDRLRFRLSQKISGFPPNWAAAASTRKLGFHRSCVSKHVCCWNRKQQLEGSDWHWHYDSLTFNSTFNDCEPPEFILL